MSRRTVTLRRKEQRSRPLLDASTRSTGLWQHRHHVNSNDFELPPHSVVPCTILPSCASDIGFPACCNLRINTHSDLSTSCLPALTTSDFQLAATHTSTFPIIAKSITSALTGMTSFWPELLRPSEIPAMRARRLAFDVHTLSLPVCIARGLQCCRLIPSSCHPTFCHPTFSTAS